MTTSSYRAFLLFIVLGNTLLRLEYCESKFVDVPKEEITPPPVTASTNGWRPLLPTTEKVSVPAANAQRGSHHRQSVSTITPYVSVHPVLSKLHAHFETAERNKRLHHHPHVEIYSHTPPSILGSFTVFGHASVKSRNISKPPKKSQILDSETSETRLTAAGRLVPPPVPLTRFPADGAYKFGFDTVDKHRQTYYLPVPQKDAAFQFLSPPKTENKYYYTSVGEFPSHYSSLGATQILSPVPQSQYFPSASISHTSTKFGDTDVVKFLPQSTDIQVSGGENVATHKPHHLFVQPPRVQDIPQIPVTPSSQHVFTHSGRAPDAPVTPSSQQLFVHPGRVQESSSNNQHGQQVYAHVSQISTGTPSPQQVFVHPGRIQDSSLYNQDKYTTSSPQQVTFVQPGRVQDVSIHNAQSQTIPDKDTQAFSVYQTKKNKNQYETTTFSIPKWSPQDPYRSKLSQQTSSSVQFKKDHAENVRTGLNHLLDGRILPGSTPLTFEKEELPVTTTPPPQEVPKKVYYPTQQTFAQVPILRGTAEKLRIARPYFDQDRTIRNEQEQSNPQYELDDEAIPSGQGSPHSSLYVNKVPSTTKYPEVRTTRKPLKPLLPTPLTEEVEDAEEQDYPAQSHLEEEQNEIRTHLLLRPTVRTRLPIADLEENETPHERPYRPRRPVTRRPVTDYYEEDTGFRSQTPADDSTNTRRERWPTSANRPERIRNRNRYTFRQNESEYLKQKRRRRPSEYHEDGLTTVPADFQFSTVGDEVITTTPVYSDYRKPNRGRERHRNRLPPVHRRVVTSSTTPPTEEPSDTNWQQDEHSQSTSSNIFDEPHTLNEIYEADEFTSSKSTTTSTESTIITTTLPTTTTTTEPTTTTSTTTTEPTTTSAALRIRNRYRYRANTTRPRFSVKDYKERLTKLSSIAHSSPGEEPENENHDSDTVTNEETRNKEVQDSVKTAADEENSGSFDIMKTEEVIKDTKIEVTSTLAPTRIRQPLRTRGTYHYSSTPSSATSTTTTEPSTRSRYRQREHSRYNPSLRSRYSTTSTTTTDAPTAGSSSTERLNLFKPANVRQYRPGLKYNRYRSSTEIPTAEDSSSTAESNDEDASSTKIRNNPYTATRKPYPYRSRYSAKVTSSTEKPADADTANSDVTEVTSSDTLKTSKDAAHVMSEKIDTTTSESQEVLDGAWSTTLAMSGGSVSTTTSASDSNSIIQPSVTDLPTFAPAYHEDQEDLSQRIADLTSSASSAGYFKTMAPPQRTNLRITMATDDPILPIEAFFPIRSKGGDRR